MTVEVEDHLEHYGVPGMKWGKRKIADTRERNTAIKSARAKQDSRKAEVRHLTAKRINARTEKGKAHLDAKIANKKFEIDNGIDSKIAAQRTSGENVMRGVRIAGMIGLSVVGLGTAASIVNSELADQRNKGMGEKLTEEWKREHGSGSSTTLGSSITTPGYSIINGKIIQSHVSPEKALEAHDKSMGR